MGDMISIPRSTEWVFSRMPSALISKSLRIPIHFRSIHLDNFHIIINEFQRQLGSKRCLGCGTKGDEEGWGHWCVSLGKRKCWQRWPGLESRRWNSSDAPFQLAQELWSGGTKGWKTRSVCCLAGCLMFFCTCNGTLRTVWTNHKNRANTWSTGTQRCWTANGGPSQQPRSLQREIRDRRHSIKPLWLLQRLKIFFVCTSPILT